MMSNFNLTDERERVHVITSGYCNNNCLFCCDRDPYITAKIRNLSLYGFPNLTLESFIKESRKIDGVNSMLFTGGEPTLNKNLLTCISLAKKLGYKSIGIQTNGRTLFYKKFCIKLLNAGLTEVNISIHGSNNRIHEGLTRTPGGFEQTCEGLSNLFFLKDKYLFKINTNSTISKLNYKDIHGLLQKLQSFNKIDNIVLNLLMYTGNAKKFFNQLFISYTEVAEEVKKSIDRLKNDRVHKSLFVSLSPMPLCLMCGYEKYVGVQEIPINIQNNRTIVLSRGSIQVRARKCNLCKYYYSCSGVDKLYAERIGWKEFHPVR